MEDRYLKIFKEFGPSGDEEGIREYLKTLMQDKCECSTDVMGNLICVMKSGKAKAKRIMLAAHMDQIGFIVTHIDKKGYARFHPIGGQYPYNQVMQRVIFKNGTKGVIEVDNQENISKLKIDNLYLDIMAKDKEDAEKHISIGDRFVWKRKAFVQNNCLCSIALDDRVGCLSLVMLAEEVKDALHDLYIVFTVQEEVGVRGAKTSAYAIDPDLGIALDITGSDDGPGVEPTGSVSCEMGKGVAIKVMDQGIIVPKAIVDFEVELCKKNNIPYQLEVLRGGATDSYAIHLTKSGIPSSTLSIPTRHVHSCSEVCSIDDLRATVDLLKAIVGEEELPI